MWSRAFFRLFRASSRRNFGRSFANHRDRRPHRSFVPQLAATAAATTTFSFSEHGVDDKERGSDTDVHNEFSGSPGSDWEVMVKEKLFQAHRRPVGDPSLLNYEYRCAGTYLDISPKEFMDAQLDSEYRRRWDSNILSLEVISEEGNQQVIRWVAHYPYPLYPREYVFVRRTWVSVDEIQDEKETTENGDDDRTQRHKIAVVVSKAISPDVVPSGDPKGSVRVLAYESRMIVRAHKNWDEHGVDYVLTYSDNPEANIPKYAYNWMVNHAGPYFLKQVHKAARELEVERRTRRRKEEEKEKSEKKENLTKEKEGTKPEKGAETVAEVPKEETVAAVVMKEEKPEEKEALPESVPTEETSKTPIPLTSGQRLKAELAKGIPLRHPDSSHWFKRQDSEDKKNFLWSAPYDARFPQVRKQRQCFAYYVDFHRCRELMGVDYEPCHFFRNVYRDLCPAFWVEKWDELVTEGRFPARFDR